MKLINPQHFKKVNTWLLYFIMVGAFTACQKNKVEPGITEKTTEDIETILREAGVPVDPVEKEDITTTEFETEENGTLFSCTRTEVDATIAPEQFNHYDPNTEVIIAGMLLKGNSLDKGTPDRIPIQRGGGTITISTLNGSQTVSNTVDEFTNGNYFQAVNELLQTNSGIVPAKFTFSIHQIRTEEEFELALQANATFLRRIKTSLSFSTDLNKKFNRIMVNLDQSYYNILFDRPNQVAGFFHPEVDPAELQRHVGPLNPMTYISSVNIGRRFALLIESTEEASVIEAAASACFSGNCGSGSTKVLSSLSDLRIKAFALGGEANQLIQAVTGSISELTEFLASSGDIRTGVPLSYVVRTVLEDKVVKNGVSTKYTLENCVPVAPQSCDCGFKGDDCDIPKTVQKFNSRTFSKGSGGIDANARVTQEEDVVVGMAITVSNEIGIKKNRVRILRLIVRKVNPDGTLGPKKVIKSSQGNDNGAAEIEFEAPGNRILTGIGLRVQDTNVNRARFHHSELFLDDASCELKIRDEKSVVFGDGGGLEREYRLSSDYDYNNVTPCITGIAVGAHDDNINILKVEVGELVLK